MRKATSMRELSRDDQDIMIDAEETKMADKIDNFLQTVKEQQESLAKMLEQRRMRRPSGMSSTKQTVVSHGNLTRKRSNTSSLNNTKAKVNSWISRPPNKSIEARRKPANQNNSFKMNNGMRPVPAFSVEDVTSKLKGDRNYQPPRRKRVQQRPMQQSRSLTRQETIKSTEEYNDDFEEEDDVNERDDEDMITKKKEAWLYDQAIRGRARQKAAQAMKMNQKISGYQEKESSKDSAYGFSGGENSRLHTREPTPDTNILAPKIITPLRRTSSRHQQNAASKRKQFLNNLKGPSTPPGRKYVSKSPNNMVSNKSPIRHIVDQGETDKVEFLNQVTKEILARGNFTEKAIKRALESQLNSNGHVIQRVTLTEKTALVNKLKADLGIERPSSSSRPSAAARQRSSNSESSSTSTSPKDSKRHKEVHENDNDDLSLLLASESDADLVEIIKSVRKCTKPRIQESNQFPHSDKSALKEDKRKVSQMSQRSNAGNQLDSLNLTNLNVSFNSCNMAEAKRRYYTFKR